MDWINELDPQTVILVPTRTLANSLNEQIAQYYLQQQRRVWEAPDILNWSDYLSRLWQANRVVFTKLCGAHSLINQQQSKLLWTQVIEASKRDETELTLLNVQQTVRAAQASWRMMSDWRLSADQLALDHGADTQQFLRWLEDYQALLKKRKLIDQFGLIACLLNEKLTFNFSSKKQIWHCFDFLTDAQQQLIDGAQKNGVAIVHSHLPELKNQQYRFYRYANAMDEINATLSHARNLIEQDPDHTINIVIPELTRIQPQVSEAVRDTFYAKESPLEVQDKASIVRFSLGKTLSEWSAISTALSIIRLLRNYIRVSDLTLLLRSEFLSFSQIHAESCRAFSQWLSQQRMTDTHIDALADLYLQSKGMDSVSDTDPLFERLKQIQQQRESIQVLLDKEKEQSGYAAMNVTEWPAIFEQWLAGWGWHEGAHSRVSESSLSSLQFQLLNRWQVLLEEFANLIIVQRRMGLRQAIELITLMARETIFLPQSAESPIVISGVYEAIGRPVDTCFLLGQDQSYPTSAKPDAFIPNRLLQKTSYPYANTDSGLAQAQKVQHSLLRGASQCVISYARISLLDRDVQQSVSPLYRTQFQGHQFEDKLPEPSMQQSLEYHYYRDTQGPAWHDPSEARGGSSIFANQSNCAFKAFATHQLGFLIQDEAEFGLDGLDRGNIVHRLLECAWEKLQHQSALHHLLENHSSDNNLESFCEQCVSDVLSDPLLNLNEQKRILLQAEKPRLIELLHDWLKLEATRPQGFAVVETETQGQSNIGGINFSYTIDRIDIADDGRSVIVDYKTGLVNRNDWLGERIRQPQLPMYALALDAAKNQAVSGIAYASVRQHEHAFIELSESGIFKKDTRYTQGYQAQWELSRADWPELFAALAEDFIAGRADVNPIDETSCHYCELHTLCRIAQLNGTITEHENNDQ